MNWVAKVWADQLKCDAITSVNGKRMRWGDAVAAFRRDMYERHGNAVYDWASAASVGPAMRFDDQLALNARSTARQVLSFLEKHEYAPAKWANGGLIPITSEVDEGANVYEWHEMGVASEGVHIISNAATDIPTVNVTGDVNIGKAAGFAKAFGYSQQDLRNGKFMKRNIASELGTACKESLDRDLNSLIASGHAGLFKGVFDLDAPSIANSRGAWSTETTFTDIVDTLREGFSLINVSSKGVEVPDTCVMPQASMLALRSKEFSSSSARSVFDFLKEAFPEIKRWDYTAENDADGSLLLYKNDATRIRAEVPMAPVPHELEKNGLNYRTIMEARYGGIILRRPESFLKITGIET